MKKLLTGVACFFTLVLCPKDSPAYVRSLGASCHNNSPLVNCSSLSSCGTQIALTSHNRETAALEDQGEGKFEDNFGTADTIRDPLQSYNRIMYGLNDKIYFYLLKPTARAYKTVTPRSARVSINKFFLNLYTPIRLVNCELQGNHKGAIKELSRFFINTTVGLAGFFDPAKSRFKLEMQKEDFGQTLGCFMPSGCYLVWIFMGPSNIRDSIGTAVDMLIFPSLYVLVNYSYIYTGLRFLETINKTSLTLGEYEDLKRSAVDPYVSIRDAYFQHRENLIQE